MTISMDKKPPGGVKDHNHSHKIQDVTVRLMVQPDKQQKSRTDCAIRSQINRMRPSIHSQSISVGLWWIE
jgi:hypothetical protein